MSKSWKRRTFVARGGEQFGWPGIYLNLRTGEFVEHKGGLLPGSTKDGYIRLPRPLVFILGPAAGGVYVLFLPLMAIAAVFYILVRWVARATRSLGESVLVALAIPPWVPGRSYLLRFQSRRKAAPRGRVDKEMEKLLGEVEEKRREERKG